MVKRSIAIVALLAVTFLIGSPAGAITNGQPDDGAHPYVGQLLFYVPDAVDSRFDDPGGWFSCSGTLLNSTVVLTAGHCTFGVGLDGEPTTEDGGSGGNEIWVNFAEEPNWDGFPLSSGYGRDENDQRYADRVAWLEAEPGWQRGAAYPHPDYYDPLFYLHDAGVVQLATTHPMAQYGALAELGYLSALPKPKSQHRFTAVGYGLEKVLPWGAFGGDTRRTANLQLVNLQGVFGAGKGIAATFSNNKGKVHLGGTCFGDSGGPVFVKDTNLIVAVTSFGLSPNCTGVGGGYRIDQADDLDWLESEWGITP